MPPKIGFWESIKLYFFLVVFLLALLTLSLYPQLLAIWPLYFFVVAPVWVLLGRLFKRRPPKPPPDPPSDDPYIPVF
jgi:hypothetical protein